MYGQWKKWHLLYKNNFSFLYKQISATVEAYYCYIASTFLDLQGFEQINTYRW